MDVQTNQSKNNSHNSGIKSKVIYHTYTVHSKHSQFDINHLTVNSGW
jgi:hypothetical protein